AASLAGVSPILIADVNRIILPGLQIGDNGH
ncbi:MAG: hypothetical protein H6Q82_1046, partial [Deltaproteobacteria bacterium]|nr:hypothetical protein [Deltaproteobacteria bacterium]